MCGTIVRKAIDKFVPSAIGSGKIMIWCARRVPVGVFVVCQVCGDTGRARAVCAWSPIGVAFSRRAALCRVSMTGIRSTRRVFIVRTGNTIAVLKGAIVLKTFPRRALVVWFAGGSIAL